VEDAYLYLSDTALSLSFHYVDKVYARLIDCSLEKRRRMIFVKWMRITVSAMPPLCRNWQNAYFISFSKGLGAPDGQPLSLHLKKWYINRGFGGSN
jgi:hypothetical protein